MEESTITFTFDGTTYSAKKGSTWAEWLETAEAKASGLSVNSSNYVEIRKNRYVSQNSPIWSSFDELIKGSDIINTNGRYFRANPTPDKT